MGEGREEDLAATLREAFFTNTGDFNFLLTPANTSRKSTIGFSTFTSPPERREEDYTYHLGSWSTEIGRGYEPTRKGSTWSLKGP